MLTYIKKILLNTYQKIILLCRNPIQTMRISFSEFRSGFPELRYFLKTYPRYIFIIVISTILPLIVATIIFLISTATKPTILMPQLEGLSIIDASSIIQDKNISFSIIPQDSEEYPQNFIIHQDIPAGRSIKKGRIITLYVSNGSGSSDFPSLIGKNIFKIQTNLTKQADISKAININNISWVDSTKPFGEVIQQSPQSGNYRNFPVSTDLVVSNGSSNLIPNTIGEYATYAFYQAQQMNLHTTFIFEKTNNSNDDGKVIRQIPDPGTPITKNIKLQLIIAQSEASGIEYFTYQVDNALDKQVISLILNDDRGKKILFSGYALAGDNIATSIKTYGKWKAGIYTYNNGQEVLFKDLSK